MRWISTLFNRLCLHQLRQAERIAIQRMDFALKNSWAFSFEHRVARARALRLIREQIKAREARLK